VAPIAKAIDNQIYCYNSICQLILSITNLILSVSRGEKMFIELSTTQTSKTLEDIINIKDADY